MHQRDFQSNGKNSEHRQPDMRFNMQQTASSQKAKNQLLFPKTALPQKR